MAAPGPRRMAREAALQVLFATDFSEAALAPALVEKSFESVVREFDLPKRARERALELCLGVAREREALDKAVGEASANWKVARLATVDRAVLRIAAYELLFEPETPTEIVIDEAVEIARRFASESSPAFVNGVLDLLARRARGGTGA